MASSNFDPAIYACRPPLEALLDRVLHKKPRICAGLGEFAESILEQMKLDLVEVGGIEPPSEDSTSLALHA